MEIDVKLLVKELILMRHKLNLNRLGKTLWSLLKAT